MTGAAARHLDAIRSIALLFVSLAVGVLAAEGFLRLFGQFRPAPRWYVGEQAGHPSKNFLPDSVTGWRMRPLHTFTGSGNTTVSSNAQGMRNPDNFAATCGKPRIVLIGDSFFWGWGLEYSATLAAQLADSLGQLADVYNLAMPGFGLDQMYLSLHHQALALCPSLIVVGFIDEDWDRSLSAFRPASRQMAKPMFLLDHDTLRLATPADRPSAMRRFLEGNSRLWRLVERAVRKRAYTNGGSTWWHLNTALLAAMTRDARAARVPILFLRIPPKGKWRAFPALRERMAREGRAYVDLADPSLERRDIFLASDEHFNALGAAYAVSAIVRWLRAAGPASLRSFAPP